MSEQSLQVIAHISTEFPSKFGIPRQSGLVEELRGRIIFTPPFRNADMLRGLEDFSHLWLLWLFSATAHQGWSPTVRPPRLGGNKRRGVFATRSPFRPNPLGRSCVRILDIGSDAQLGPFISVSGADLMDGTPIVDIKPYLPFTDAHPDARGGFATAVFDHALQVIIPEELSLSLPSHTLDALKAVLAQDPRPSYQDDEQRVYGMDFANHAVKFRVAQNKVFVVEISPL